MKKDHYTYLLDVFTSGDRMPIKEFLTWVERQNEFVLAMKDEFLENEDCYVIFDKDPKTNKTRLCLEFSCFDVIKRKRRTQKEIRLDAVQQNLESRREESSTKKTRTRSGNCEGRGITSTQCDGERKADQGGSNVSRKRGRPRRNQEG